MVMLCEKLTLGELREREALFGERWEFQNKLDGERLTARFENGLCVEAFNRRGVNKLACFVELKRARASVNCLLDGEMVAESNDFSEVLKRQVASPSPELAARIPLRFIAFDLLEVEGKSLARVALNERLTRLREVVLASEGVEALPSFPLADLKAFWDLHAGEQNFEGVVLKDLRSFYEDKRSRAWLKVKNRREFVLKVKRTERTALGGFVFYADYAGVEQKIVVNSLAAQPRVREGVEVEVEAQRVNPSGKLFQPSFKRVRGEA